ncbi:hypothetical protein [Anaerosporobacter sp.]|uniref:hypothetical protein n=1 Tax=Anaerosporobacter sp. TaxID=1872529 RepID=UPI00286F09E7|nr:hypothetical protein [Anaerosporobacter sp.]
MKNVNVKNEISLEWNGESVDMIAGTNPKEKLEDSNTCKYPIPAGRLMGAASIARLVERTMRAEGASPYEIAKVLKHIFLQAGIEVQDDFVKVPLFEQLTLETIQKCEK